MVTDETVEDNNAGSGKTLTVGADEFTPIFIYIVLMSDTVDIYSCINFIEHCAPESKAYSGEGAYYLMQLSAAAQVLDMLARVKLPAEGMLPIGEGSQEDDDGSGLSRLLSSQVKDGDIQWVWSYADDSSKELGRVQDMYVPYDAKRCEELELARTEGRTLVQIDERRHLDLSSQASMWQVVTTQSHLRRHVVRETAAQSMLRREVYQAHVVARAKRDEVEVARHGAEVLLYADKGIPAGTMLSMWPGRGVDGPVGEAEYVSFTSKVAGANKHTVRLMRADSVQFKPDSAGAPPDGGFKEHTFQLKDYDARVIPPSLLGDDLPVAVDDGRFSSAYGSPAVGAGFGRGGLYSPECWRPEKNQEGEWYELDLGGIREVIGLITKGRAGFAQNKLQEWVTLFRVEYTRDTRHAVSPEWKEVMNDASTETETFRTNQGDGDSPWESQFPTSVCARFIRVYPLLWQGKSIALRCGALCTGKMIPDAASPTPSVHRADGASSTLLQHLRKLLAEDPSRLIGLDVDIKSVSAGRWIKGKILAVQSPAEGLVSVQYYVPASACKHGVAGLRNKVVSINDPNSLKESYGASSQTVVGEPLGARSTVTQVDQADADDMVVVDAPAPSRVTVGVTCESGKSDVYTVTVYIGQVPVHSFAGSYSELERKLPNKKQPYGSLPKLWGSLPPSKTTFPSAGNRLLGKAPKSQTGKVDNAQSRVRKTLVYCSWFTSSEISVLTFLAAWTRRWNSFVTTLARFWMWWECTRMRRALRYPMCMWRWASVELFQSRLSVRREASLTSRSLSRSRSQQTEQYRWSQSRSPSCGSESTCAR